MYLGFTLWIWNSRGTQGLLCYGVSKLLCSVKIAILKPVFLKTDNKLWFFFSYFVASKNADLIIDEKWKSQTKRRSHFKLASQF